MNHLRKRTQPWPSDPAIVAMTRYDITPCFNSDEHRRIEATVKSLTDEPLNHWAKGKVLLLEGTTLPPPMYSSEVARRYYTTPVPRQCPSCLGEFRTGQLKACELNPPSLRSR